MGKDCSVVGWVMECDAPRLSHLSVRDRRVETGLLRLKNHAGPLSYKSNIFASLFPLSLPLFKGRHPIMSQGFTHSWSGNAFVNYKGRRVTRWTTFKLTLSQSQSGSHPRPLPKSTMPRTTWSPVGLINLWEGFSWPAVSAWRAATTKPPSCLEQGMSTALIPELLLRTPHQS